MEIIEHLFPSDLLGGTKMLNFTHLYNYTMIIILVLIELFHGAQFVVMTKGVGKRM